MTATMMATRNDIALIPGCWLEGCPFRAEEFLDDEVARVGRVDFDRMHVALALPRHRAAFVWICRSREKTT